MIDSHRNSTNWCHSLITLKTTRSFDFMTSFFAQPGMKPDYMSNKLILTAPPASWDCTSYILVIALKGLSSCNILISFTFSPLKRTRIRSNDSILKSFLSRPLHFSNSFYMNAISKTDLRMLHSQTNCRFCFNPVSETCLGEGPGRKSIHSEEKFISLA